MFSSPAFTGTVSVAGSIVPTTNVAYDLGSTTYRFKDLYLSGSTIDLGGVLISAAAGSVSFPGLTNTPIGATSPSTGSFTTLATSGNLVVGGDLTVAGSLNVTGNVFTTSATNLSVSDNIIYLGGGDTVVTTFLNGGLNDMLFHGVYEGLSPTTYYVKITSDTGAADKFSWSKDNFVTTVDANVTITTAS
jgi:hypothetical protein